VELFHFSWKHYRHEAKVAGISAISSTPPFGFEPCKLAGGAFFPEEVENSILQNPHQVIFFDQD
jgi:hypothetical protein